MSKQQQTAHSAHSKASRLTFRTTGRASECRTKYGYDPLGQVSSGAKFWADQTPVAGQQFGYTFDDIGNRKQTQFGGDQNGAGLRTASYTANLLNQYTTRTVPGYVEIMGLARVSDNVSINGSAPSWKGEYFWKELSVANSSASVWQPVTVSAPGEPTSSGNIFVPQTPEQFTYDLDGNVTNDGRWSYGWDAENRLVALTNRTAIGPQQVIRFDYDHQGRRVRKQVWAGSSGSGNPTNDTRFVYDGWNLIAELDGLNNCAPLRFYVWGTDLSGTTEGAGGVGGLLFIGNQQTPTGTFAPAFDGNGNIMALVNVADGTISAQYEYGPFGELLRTTGAMAELNPFRFSTKYQDDESDVVYYGYRYYNPSTGRWLSRDPLGEDGSYLFACNNSLSVYDVLGLWDERVHNVRTAQWAGELGIASSLAHNIGVFDDAVDRIYSTGKVPPFSDGNWSWHFNRSRSSDPNDDTRLKHRDEEVAKAKRGCTAPTDSAYNAATYLGLALHPLQDWVAHGDFNRWQETPSLTGVDIVEARHYWHNWDAGGWFSKTQLLPDEPTVDSDGVDGRATFLSGVMFLGTTLSNGDRTYYTHFHTGSERIRKTQELTKGLLSDFQDYVRTNGKPCGECQRLFLGGN